MVNQTVTLNVEGMSCMHCVNAVQKSVGSLPGVEKVEVDLAGKKVSVAYDAGKVDINTIKDKIDDAGYQVV